MEFLTSLPVEVQAAIGVAVIYWLDVWVTKSPNPLDNILVRGLKVLWARYLSGKRRGTK